MTSPTQKSLAKLRKEGWVCAITEKYNAFIKIRQDLYGFIDILCIREGEMLAIQTTTNTNAPARVEKIKKSPYYKLLKSTGCKIHVHGWRKLKQGKRHLWKCRVIII